MPPDASAHNPPPGGWQAPGAVVLISCYELGHQPLGAASPLAFLRRAGFRPRAVDLATECLPPDGLEGARFAGISVPMHTALRLGVAAARRIRETDPDCHICFYGHYALLNADYLLSHDGDSAIGGEFEATLVDLVGALAAGRPAGGVPGVATRGRTAAPRIERLPFLPPARDGLPPLDAYARLQRNGELLLAGAVEASRGCKHLCLHCPLPPVYGGRFFAVPKEVVLADVRALAGRGARHITFADPDFLNGPSHALRVARAMHAEFPGLTFDFTAKVSHLLKHEGLLSELAALGCIFIVTAVESLSDTVLENLGKGHTRADVLRAVEASRAAGISLRPSLVAFTPWTTPEDYFELLDFVEGYGLVDEVDPVQLAIRLLVPPGSDLLGTPQMAPFLRGLDEENFIHRWEHPDPRMDRLHEAVLPLVEEAAGRGEDPAVAFGRIREAAAELLGQPGRTTVLTAAAEGRVRPPRLTESWFC